MTSRKGKRDSRHKVKNIKEHDYQLKDGCPYP